MRQDGSFFDLFMSVAAESCWCYLLSSALACAPGPRRWAWSSCCPEKHYRRGRGACRRSTCSRLGGLIFPVIFDAHDARKPQEHIRECVVESKDTYIENCTRNHRSTVATASAALPPANTWLWQLHFFFFFDSSRRRDTVGLKWECQFHLRPEQPLSSSKRCRIRCDKQKICEIIVRLALTSMHSFLSWRVPSFSPFWTFKIHWESWNVRYVNCTKKSA